MITNKVIPLKNNTELYKKYNLLNTDNKIKHVNPTIHTKKWVKTLNLSPYYRFSMKLCADGKWRIFIENL